MSNPELARNSEAEIICERIVKEFPFAKPLVEVFEELTFNDRKLKGDSVIGRVKEKFGPYRPIMRLEWEENYPEVNLNIYEGKNRDISNILNILEDVRFRAFLIVNPDRITEKNFGLVVEFNLKKLSLPSEYLKFLNMVENKINERAFNSQNSQKIDSKI
jgi:hypothetical protein